VALSIADPEVENLAGEVQRLLKAPTLTEAVRTALRHEMDAALAARAPSDRIREVQSEYAALGPDSPEVDLKRFSMQCGTTADICWAFRDHRSSPPEQKPSLVPER
jgi:antitoxin VapB